MQVQLRVSDEKPSDRRLVVGEGRRAVVRIESAAVAPALHEKEVAGVGEHLGEHERGTAVLLQRLRLEREHRTLDRIPLWDLRIDVSERDDHLSSIREQE